jgi:hypothetical protein
MTMKNEFETRLELTLRESAKAGNRTALRRWRELNGYPEEPHPTCPSLPNFSRSWYWERSCVETGPEREAPEPTGEGFGSELKASSAAERASMLWGELSAMEESFSRGLSTFGERTGSKPMKVETPSEHRARRAAVAEALKAVEKSREALAKAAKAGGNRASLLGLRTVLGRREKALERASRGG